MELRFLFGTQFVAIRNRFELRVEICLNNFCLRRAMNEFSLDLARRSASVGFPFLKLENNQFSLC
jgi:hypothetical protein